MNRKTTCSRCESDDVEDRGAWGVGATTEETPPVPKTKKFYHCNTCGNEFFL